MRRFSLLWSCRNACTDRPDRFVGDDYLNRLCLGDPGQTTFHLPIQHLFGLARLTFAEQFTDTKHGRQAAGNSRTDLPIDDRVRLTHHVAAFAVAQNYVATATISQHVDRDFARKCTRSFKIGILRTQVNSTASQLLTDGQQIRVRRANQHLNTNFSLRNNRC